MIKADLFTIFPKSEKQVNSPALELPPIETIEVAPEPEPETAEPLIPKVVNTLVSFVWGTEKEKTRLIKDTPNFGKSSLP